MCNYQINIEPKRNFVKKISITRSMSPILNLLYVICIIICKYVCKHTFFSKFRMSLVEQPLDPIETLNTVETVLNTNISKGHQLFDDFCEVEATLRKRTKDPKFQKYGDKIEKVLKNVEASKDQAVDQLLDQEDRKVHVQLRRFEDEVTTARILEESVAAVRNCFLRIPLPGTRFFYAIETPKEFGYHLFILVLLFWVFKLLLSF